MEKYKLPLAILLIILLAGGIIFTWVQAAPPIRNVNTGRGYYTIKDALEDPNTKNGHTIVVDPGVYTEFGINIKKSVTLRSSTGKPEDTIIRGKSGETIFYVWVDRVNITGFTIRSTFQGIYLKSNFCNIFNNVFINNEYGIAILDGSKNNNIFDNNIIHNNLSGIILLYAGAGNIISRNNFTGNRVGVNIQDTNGSVIYLNNFLNNEENVYIYKSTSLWNSPEKINYTYNGKNFLNHLGNYWSDYKGRDEDGDGIGDVPHLFNGKSDDYPLIQPFGKYEIQKPRYYLKVISEIGKAEGEGWYHAGVKAKVSISSTVVEKGPGERYVFTGWSGDVKAESPTLYVDMDGNKTVYANWKRQFFVRALTEISSFEGGNDWYDEGSTVTLRLKDTAVGFLVRYVFSNFEGLKPADVVKGSEVQIKVDGPREIRAVWKKDYTQLILIAVIAVVVIALIAIAVLKKRR